MTGGIQSLTRFLSDPFCMPRNEVFFDKLNQLQKTGDSAKKHPVKSVKNKVGGKFTSALEFTFSS